MKRLLWLTVLVSLVLFGACGSGDASEQADGSAGAGGDGKAPEVQHVQIGAREYSYDAPAELESGTTELTMQNDGKEPHIVVLAKIDAGKTFEDVTAALSAPPGTSAGPPPFKEVAGIASTDPGLSSNQTVTLAPGSYAFVCFLPSPDGVPHFAKGMMQPFEVTDASEEEAAPLPEADADVVALDFSYRGKVEVKAGEQVVALKNEGAQTHEITLAEFAAGKGPAELQAFFAKPEGPPPAKFLGGPVIAPGASTTWRTPRLDAGKSYFFLCLIPDPADQVPHVAKGMALPVTVT